MKIGNSTVYFTNPNTLPPEDCKYYAVYDYNAEGVVYMGTYTKDAIIEDITNNYQKYGRHIHCYARKTQFNRGKDGRYEVTIKTSNGVITKRIKNKSDAKRNVQWRISCGHFVRIIDLDTGEVIGHWNDEVADEEKINICATHSCSKCPLSQECYGEHDEVEDDYETMLPDEFIDKYVK